MKDDLRLQGPIVHAGRLAAEAVEMVYAVSGSSVAKRGQRLGRYVRDVASYRTHPNAQLGVLSLSWAAAYFGLPRAVRG